MAQPVIYNWNNTFSDMLAPAPQMTPTAQDLVLNQPIRLSEFADLSWNPTNPNQRYSNVQPISVKVSFTPSTAPVVQLTVTGIDGYGKVQVEVLSVPNTATAAITVGFFRSITSVVPTSFGTATGLSITNLIPNLTNTSGLYSYTTPFICDVWNKQALYAYSVQDVTTGDYAKIIAQYTMTPMPQWNVQGLSGQQPFYNPVWVPFPTVQQATLALPSVNLPNMPMTAINFQLKTGTLTSPFTATILQQGGYY